MYLMFTNDVTLKSPNKIPVRFYKSLEMHSFVTYILNDPHN